MKLFICHKKVANTFVAKKSHWRRWQTMVFIKPSSKKSTERNSQFFKESLTKEERVYREEQKVSLRVPKLHRFNKHHDVWSYCNVKKSLFQTSSKLLSLPYYDQHIETLKKKNDKSQKHISLQPPIQCWGQASTQVPNRDSASISIIVYKGSSLNTSIKCLVRSAHLCPHF